MRPHFYCCFPWRSVVIATDTEGRNEDLQIQKEIEEQSEELQKKKEIDAQVGRLNKMIENMEKRIDEYEKQ